MQDTNIIKNNNIKIIESKDNISPTGKLKLTFRDGKTDKIKRISEYKNLITTAGAVAIARRLIEEGAVANEGIITWGATGTGAGTPAIGDTALFTELKRVAILTTSRASNVITVRAYYTTTESNGTLTEFGLFGEDASAAADSGTMFEHATISEEKTIAETLTIDVEITIAVT